MIYSRSVFGTTSVSTYHSIFQLSLKRLRKTRHLSLSYYSQDSQLRLQPSLSCRKQEFPALQYGSSHLYSGLISKCSYCTKTKVVEHLNIAEAPVATDVSRTENKEAETLFEDRGMDNINHSEFAYGGDEGEPIDSRALIELEIELLRQAGHHVPDMITPSQWAELLSRSSRKARRVYLKFLFLTQMKNENSKKKKELKRIEREKAMELIDASANRYVSEDGHIQYGLWCNTIFLRILDSSMNQFYHGQLFNAMMYGQPIVFDLGYDAHMNSRERQRCANQIMNSFASNRVHPEPFYLHICNAPKESDTVQKLHRFIPTMYNPEFPMTITPESYLDCFPKDKLVYLTPHCREELTKFDHDAVYIIGGLVDLGDSEPLSLAKAKREGIRMQKFPLERYLNWGLGGKSLTLNQTLDILLDLKYTDNWNYSLKHIPRRKLKTFEDSQAQLEHYMRKSLKKFKDPNGRNNKQELKNRMKTLYSE